MSIKDLSKDELELYSHKDLTDMLLNERGPMNTSELFKEITTLLELPSSVFENKIGDYYTTLTTDKRFIMLDDGKWDLREKYTSDKVVTISEHEDEEEDEEDEIVESKEEQEDEDESENFDATRNDDDFEDTSDDDLKDLVIIDEDELELEE